MSSLLLRWVANGMIAAVLACTVWIAHSVQPSAAGLPLLMAHAATPAAPAAPASAATP